MTEEDEGREAVKIAKAIEAIKRKSARYVFVATYGEIPGPGGEVAEIAMTVLCNDPIKERTRALLLKWAADPEPFFPLSDEVH